MMKKTLVFCSLTLGSLIVIPLWWQGVNLQPDGTAILAMQWKGMLDGNVMSLSAMFGTGMGLLTSVTIPSAIIFVLLERIFAPRPKSPKTKWERAYYDRYLK